MQVALLHLLDVWQILAKYIFHPADHFHAALFRRRKDFLENVEVAVIGSVLGWMTVSL